jgi:hypothetical protein
MPTNTRPASLDVTAQFDEWLARAGARERAGIEKHLALCEGESTPGHAQLWRRLAAKLGTLAPLSIKTAGPHAVLFFVADGKYRMQVFALEDRSDGFVVVYLPDVLEAAIESKLLLATRIEGEYTIGSARRAVMQVHAMDAANTPEPPEHVKHMLGWKRRAVRLTLSAADPQGPQVGTAESLCELAAEQWAPQPQ